ncbi:L,D-transpeptidase family protein [Bacillus sp. AK128]
MELPAQSRKETATLNKRRKRMYVFLSLMILIFTVAIFYYKEEPTNDKMLATKLTFKEIEVSAKDRVSSNQEVIQNLSTTPSEEETKDVISEELVAEESVNKVLPNSSDQKELAPKPQKTIKNSFSRNSGMLIIEHTVQSKETLYSISKLYYEKDHVEQLLLFNNIQHPELEIKEGMKILIPNPTYLTQHKVQKGETLYQIIRTFYSKSKLVNYLSEYNNIEDPSLDIQADKRITVFHDHQLISHTIRPTETLFGIMSSYYKFSTFLSMTKEVNQISENITIGQTIKIVNPYRSKAQTIIDDVIPDWMIRISLKNNQLTIYKDSEIYKTVTVATGKESLTPKGTYRIITKISNPGYTPKGIPGGDPRNPLGTRWLGLDVNGTSGRTYGIHGTSDPTSIGKYVTNGCIRLENSVIEELFEILPLETKVIIE